MLEGDIEGGIKAAFDTLEAEAGKYGFKIRMLLAVLPKHGANAKYALPRIEAVKSGKFQKSWDATVKQIESSAETGRMISIEEAKKAGLKSEEWKEQTAWTPNPQANTTTTLSP